MSKAIAVLGCSYKLPATQADANFEQDLLEGKDLISVVAQDRWSFEQFHHPQKNHPGASYTFAAGSIGDVSQFDAGFFGISPREAAQIDPQHRILLELSWQAFEDAGIQPSALRGSACGVYIGISSADYSYRLAEDLTEVDSATASGNTASTAANRISYFFDLHGPSMAIDTACSSSLVAFHQACQAIRAGEITHAVTGGISLHLHPYGFVIFSKAHMLSANGHCNAFGDNVDGYVRSEGGGIFILKDYELAVADGDRILAVVAHSAVNTDGKKSGLTYPSATAQANLLSNSYAAVGIAPEEISYIEAHGTGTVVGDPIEAQALGAALGQKRNPEQPLLIGSVKSNLGHLEAASGVAGLVKALYVIQERKIPATIGIKNLNPLIDFDALNLSVVTQTHELPHDAPVIVGVNSFGFGGSNAHVILRNHESQQNSAQTTPPLADRSHPAHGEAKTAPLLPFLFSGATPAALAVAIESFAQAIAKPKLSQAQSADFVYDAAYQLAFRREALEHRAVVFGTSLEAVSEQLRAHHSRLENPNVIVGLTLSLGDVQANRSLRAAAQGPVFVYSGNGSQWLGMGRALLDDPVFKQTIAEIDRTFITLAGFSIATQLQGHLPELSYADTTVAQPALFAVQVGMTTMLAALGVTPRAVVGHSVGEISAAWAAGILTLEAAVEVIYQRSRLQHTTKGRGNMTAAAVAATTVEQWLAEEALSAHISIACVNSYRSVTLAGDAEHLSAFELRLAHEHIGYKRLDLGYAFHSPSMDGLEAELHRTLDHLVPQAGLIPFYSTVTGSLLTGTELTSDYWWRNIRQPVLFEQAVNSLLTDGYQVFVETGALPTLKSYLEEGLKRHASANGSQAVVIPSLNRHANQAQDVRAIAARIWIAGAQVDLSAFFPTKGRHTTLPTYPWQKERHWHHVGVESPDTLHRVNEHPLLGHRLPHHDLLWENKLDLDQQTFLADHVIGDTVVFPGSGYVELALAAAQGWLAEDVKQLDQIEIVTPITFSAKQSKILRVRVNPSDGRISIQTRDFMSTEDWILNAKTQVIRGVDFIAERSDTIEQRESLEQLSLYQPDFDANSHRALMRHLDLHYGEAFEAVERGWINLITHPEDKRRTLTAILRIPEKLADTLHEFHLHPGLLDSSFQLIAHLFNHQASSSQQAVFVPSKIGQVSVRAGLGIPYRVEVTLVNQFKHSVRANFALYDQQGVAIAVLDDVRFKAIYLKGKIENRTQVVKLNYLPAPHARARPVSKFPYDTTLRRAHQLTQQITLNQSYRAFVNELDPLLETLCRTYAIETLCDLGFSKDRANNKRLFEQLIENQPEVENFLSFLLSLGAEPSGPEEPHVGLMLNAIEPTLGGFAIAENHIPSSTIWKTLYADYPDYTELVESVGRVGNSLASLLTGEQALSQVLGTKQQLASLTKKLVSSTKRKELLALVSEMLRHTKSEQASHERVGLLEIAAFEPLIAHLMIDDLDSAASDLIFACPDLSKFDATQPSSLVAQRLQLDEFNADGTPSTKRTASKTYLVDLAIVWLHFDTLALNNEAIDYAIKHLKPQGALLLLGQHAAQWLDFIFGAQAAWWSELTAGQQAGAIYQDTSRWNTRLGSLGLEQVQYLCPAQSARAGHYMIFARAPLASPAPLAKVQPPKSWLLIHHSENQSTAALQDELSLALQRSGDLVCILSLTEQQSAVDTVTEQLLAMHKDYGEVDGIIDIASEVSTFDASLTATGVNRCLQIADILKACQRTKSLCSIWIVTQQVTAHTHHSQSAEALSAQTSLSSAVIVSGFTRSLQNEAVNNRIRLIDLLREDRSNALTAHSNQKLAELFVAELQDDSLETEVVLTDTGGRFVPRLQLARIASAGAFCIPPKTEAQTLQLDFTAPGQLSNLRWQATTLPDLADDEVEIKVEATGLNFRDLMYLIGLLPDEALENGFAGPTLGLECVGTLTRVGALVTHLTSGDRVVAFGPACFADSVVTKASMVSYIPLGLSAEAAVTIPSAFLTTYYALIHLARLSAGEKILIHSGTGGVGLAAIQIAQWCNAEIYATAGSEDKRALLRMMGIKHVLDSRSLKFAEEIMLITEGAGVDVVLNSLHGEAISRNLKILKPFGRYLELGKRDFYENTFIGLQPLRKNISYFGIDADQLMKERPELAAKLFQEVIELFEQKILQPLPYTSFAMHEVVEAFRFMQQSKHIGKIVLTYPRTVSLTGAASPDEPWTATRRIVQAQQSVSPKLETLQLDPQASYLVTGGLGGFGLKTALWLAEKGARHLVLLSRSGPDTLEARTGMKAIQSLGAKVSAYACDITDHAQLSKTLRPWLSKLKGIVHAAAVIEDSLIEDLTREQFENVLEPKITGALNLHTLTHAQPLDFFVLYSSATTLFGNPGQAAYVAANSALEALARQRLAEGLPATCLLWGAIEDTGFLARNQNTQEHLQRRMGGRALPSGTALEYLEQAILHRYNNEAILELDFSALFKSLPSIASPKFKEFTDRIHKERPSQEDLRILLDSLTDPELTEHLLKMLTFEVSEILHLAPAKITPQTSLYDLGLDSLMGLELINALQTNVGVRLSPLAISENPSVDKLAKLLFEALTQSTRSDSTQTDYDEEVRRVSAQHASETTNLTGSL